MKDEARLGKLVQDWTVPCRPAEPFLQGKFARLELFDANRHAAEIHSANAVDNAIWDFLPYGPFETSADYHRWVERITSGDDPVFYAIKNLENGRYEGVASFLRISPETGSIEVGHINYSKPLQRTRAATEAMFLMMRWVFEAGYRRYEWKCNALNKGSRSAAERLGFSYEGIFRQHLIAKGRNRDTAWFAAIDIEWPMLKSAYETWLAPENFDANGRQSSSLSDLTRPIRIMDDPSL